MKQNPPTDLRDILFQSVKDHVVTAVISATSPGIVSGMKEALEKAAQLDLVAAASLQDGMPVKQDEPLLLLRGAPKQIAMGEDVLIGLLAKTSGIATAAAKAVSLTKGKVRVVCGSAKKLNPTIKMAYRHAILHGGAEIRIANSPFVYLDKNYIRIFGSVAKALEAADLLEGYKKVIQIRDEDGCLEQEVEAACHGRAELLMVDTGDQRDIQRALTALDRLGMRHQMEVAFAGNVRLEDIPRLRDSGIDILCVGRDIADAPMLDLRLDVIDVQPGRIGGTSLNLLEKSELWLEDVHIDNVNLQQVAQVTAEVFGLRREDVLVVDVRPRRLVLDVLCQTVTAEQIAGKEKLLLQELSKIKGFTSGTGAHIHSNGVLGLIALDEQEAPEIVEKTREIAKRVEAFIAKRAKVFPTGFELEQGMIMDTNTPLIVHRLTGLGYRVDTGPVLPDDEKRIARALDDACCDGYSLVITTGGVGAEDKDHTVEALLSLDRKAATPWLVKYQKGTGRHVKHGVRIGVAQVGFTTLVALPGPNDEVLIAMDVLERELQAGTDQFTLAQKLAEALRGRIKAEWNHGDL